MGFLGVNTLSADLILSRVCLYMEECAMHVRNLKITQRLYQSSVVSLSSR